MSRFDYSKMQASATRLIDRFQQGEVNYIVQGPSTGPAWNPTPGQPIIYSVKAVRVKGDDFNSFVEAGRIIATDVLLAVAPFAAEPSMEGKMEINGEQYTIIMVDKATIEPGLPIVWKVGCRK